MSARRMSLAGAMAMIALIGLVMSFLASDGPRFLRAARRMHAILRSLPGKRPPEIPPLEWEHAIGAPIGACANGIAPGRVSPQELEQFNAELEQELEGEVGLETLEWIMDRLERMQVDPAYRVRLRYYIEQSRRHRDLALQSLRAESPSPGGAADAAGEPPHPGMPTPSSLARPGAGRPK